MMFMRPQNLYSGIQIQVFCKTFPNLSNFLNYWNPKNFLAKNLYNDLEYKGAYGREDVLIFISVL